MIYILLPFVDFYVMCDLMSYAPPFSHLIFIYEAEM